MQGLGGSRLVTQPHTGPHGRWRRCANTARQGDAQEVGIEIRVEVTGPRAAQRFRNRHARAEPDAEAHAEFRADARPLRECSRDRGDAAAGGRCIFGGWAPGDGQRCTMEQQGWGRGVEGYAEMPVGPVRG